VPSSKRVSLMFYSLYDLQLLKSVVYGCKYASILHKKSPNEAPIKLFDD
jgi:hypothetical protein